MIKLNKKTEYALIALIRLAAKPAGRVSAKDLAREFNIPADLMAKVLQELHAGGLIQSTQGPHGGYAISCSPEKVRLHALIELLEGPLSLIECEHDQPSAGGCEQQEHCNIRAPLHAINAQIRSLLDSYTLQDLMTARIPSPTVPLAAISVRAHA